ncbi:MAG: DUF1573 domain-containing protein [Hymenobacter sp.]
MRLASTLALSLTLCLLALAARAQGVLTFESTDHDFGLVPEGTMATHEFKFKNTGNQPVVIANAQASCGCTTPEWTKSPVLPGRSGVIKAVYNSAGRPGVFAKTVTVLSNATEGRQSPQPQGHGAEQGGNPGQPYTRPAGRRAPPDAGKSHLRLRPHRDRTATDRAPHRAQYRA